MRVAFCVQRYGPDVAGGAEALTRRTAWALAEAGDEVVVYTTTARDYLTWAPHYAAGTSRDGPVRVERFPVLPADPVAAARWVRALSLAPGDAEAERAWALAQGPVSPGLVNALAGARHHHEAVVFWTYLYAHAQLGLPACGDRALLAPLAHDEPMLRFTLSRGVTRSARGLAFMTPEEARLVDDLHGIGDRPAAVVGTGLDPITASGASGRDADGAGPAGVPTRYVLYLGRVDPAKGVMDLVRAHGAYRAAGGRLGLVLAGRPTVPLRLPPWVTTTGWLDDATRSGVLAGAEVVALPSRWESLSLVALEAWQHARPTLATARSEVLAGQTRRAGGGLTYADDAGYVAALRRLEADADLRRRLGEAGRSFAEALTWPAAVRRWRALLAQVRQPLAPA